MLPTTFEFENTSLFDYDEFQKLIPHLTTMQFLIIRNYCIHVINLILKGIYKETRKNKVEDTTAYAYRGCFPPFCKENKMFYLAAIISYLKYKGFQVSYETYETINEQKYSLYVQW